MESLEKVAQQVQECRNKLKLTQGQLAEKAGVSQSFISKLEEGTEANPAYDKVWKVFDVLDSMSKPQETEIAGHTAEGIMTKEVMGFQAKDSTGTALKIMADNEFNYAPVYDGEKIVGSVRYTDLLTSEPDSKVGEIKRSEFPTVSKKTTLMTLTPLVEESKAVLIKENGAVIGIITSDDFLKIKIK